MVQEQSSSHHHHHHHQLTKYGTAPATATGGVARASKKNKPKKIPQRGLGVAQLEKLRLEEQQKKTEGGHLLPLHPPPPPLPLGALPRPPADGGFSPVLWDAADPMKHHHHYKRMPPLPMVATGLSLTASSSHPTEPPSNQMYSSSGSRSSAAPAEEDRESAGMDRSWPFMFEGMTVAAFRSSTGKATPSTTVPFAAKMTRDAGGFAGACPDLMSRHDLRTANYFSSANASYSDLAYCKNSSNTGCAGEPAFLGLMSGHQLPANLTKQPAHVIQSAHLPEYGDFSVMRSQGGSIAASPSRPFYSFLPAGPVRCDRAPSECRADVSEGVDLELKLWTKS